MVLRRSVRYFPLCSIPSSLSLARGRRRGHFLCVSFAPSPPTPTTVVPTLVYSMWEEKRAWPEDERGNETKKREHGGNDGEEEETKLAHFFSPRFPSPAMKGWEEKRGRGRGEGVGKRVSQPEIFGIPLCAASAFLEGREGGTGVLYFVSCLLPLWLYFLTGADRSARCVLPGEAADATFPKYFFSENGVSWEVFSSLTKNTALFLPQNRAILTGVSPLRLSTQRIFQTRDMSHLTAHILLLYSPLNSLFFLPLFSGNYGK